MADFSERMDVLSAQIGHGDLQGMVNVDQIYAHYQHEGLDLKHPRGGQAKYLEAPLYGRADHYMQNLADGALNDGLEKAMIDNVSDLGDQVGILAPIDLNNLRRSHEETVTSAGREVYNHPAEVPRLTEAELRALHPGGHKYG